MIVVGLNQWRFFGAHGYLHFRDFCLLFFQTNPTAVKDEKINARVISAK